MPLEMTHINEEKCFEPSSRWLSQSNKLESCADGGRIESVESLVMINDSLNLTSCLSDDGESSQFECRHDNPCQPSACHSDKRVSLDECVKTKDCTDEQRVFKMCQFDSFDQSILLSCSENVVEIPDRKMEINLEPWTPKLQAETKKDNPVRPRKLNKTKTDLFKRLSPEYTKSKPFEFHHYNDIGEYIKQYRFHHCIGGVYKKLTKLMGENKKTNAATPEKHDTPVNSLATNYDVHSMVNLEGTESPQQPLQQEHFAERMRHLNLSPIREQRKQRCPLTRTPRLQYLSFEEYLYLTLPHRHSTIRNQAPKEPSGNTPLTAEDHWEAERSVPPSKPDHKYFNQALVSGMKASKETAKVGPRGDNPCNVSNSGKSSPRKLHGESHKERSESVAVYSLQGRKSKPDDRIPYIHDRLVSTLPARMQDGVPSHMFQFPMKKTQKKRSKRTSSAQTNYRFFVCDRTTGCDLIF